MKKLSSIILVFMIMLCFSACNGNIGEEYIYLPKFELRTNENSSGAHKEYKTVYKYDDNGNVVKKTEYTKGLFGIFHVRENQYDISYNYNESGDISRELIHVEDFNTSITDGHQIYDEGYDYIYNENRQLVKKEIIDRSEHEDALCGYEYEYDESGNLVKEYKYFADGTKELEFENVYDTQNKLIKKQYLVNFGNSSWIGNETEYTYDNDGKSMYSKTVYYESTGEQSYYAENKYNYDKLNRLIKEETTYFDNDGKITQADIKEYKDFTKKEK